MPNELNPVLNMIDVSFSKDNTTGYDLIFELGDNTFGYSLLDVQKNKFIALGYFRNPATEVIGSLSWLKESFHKVQGVIANSMFTLIPEALFLESEKESYFNFLHDRENGDVIFSERIEHLGIHNIYGVSGVTSALLRLFPEATCFHVESVLIGNLWKSVKNVSGRKVFLNLREGQFDLLVFEGNQLKYCNAFHFLTPEDIAYYVIFVFEQLNLNPEIIPLALLGNIEKLTPVYDLLFMYIRNVEFVARNEDYKYSYLFSEVPGHFYYTLLNPSSCGS